MPILPCPGYTVNYSDADMLPAWVRAWRTGFAPQYSLAALLSLREGLATDAADLMQGATCSPPPLHCFHSCPVEGADAVTYGPWKGDGLDTVGEVEDRFAHLCQRADEVLGEPAGCRWFLNWADDTPRETFRRELLAEVEREISLVLSHATV